MSHRDNSLRLHPGRDKIQDSMPWILTGLVVVMLLFFSIRLLYRSMASNIDLKGSHEDFLFIGTGDRFEDVLRTISSKGILKDRQSFIWMARRKDYPARIRPGRYRIRDGMSNRELINMLRSGSQSPVRLIIHHARSRQELAGRVSRVIEADSAGIIHLLNDPQVMARYGLNPANALALFIPNTYEFYWNTSPSAFLDRMHREFIKFWNQDRRNLANSIGLTLPETMILASIVEKETNKEDEKALIASVYLNRLKAEIMLQADPTVIYAWNDYTIKRVLKKHTLLPSPFNTYYIKGLPPGPICIPSISSIDAVLKAPSSTYFYFSAREDMSGYHRFAKTLAEHGRNARKYQEALETLNIR